VPGRAAAEDLADHWTWRPDWTTERACLLWYITFTEPQHAELHRLTRAVHDGLADEPTIDPVPLPWLHLTLDDVGFEDRLGPGEVADVVAAVFARIGDLPPPRVTLGPVTTMADALVLAVEPEAALVGLRDLLRSCTDAVLPGSTTLLDEFWPHVTLAYANTPVTRARLMAPLSGLGIADRRVDVRPHLTLAAVTRRDRHYQWTARAVVPWAPER